VRHGIALLAVALAACGGGGADPTPAGPIDLLAPPPPSGSDPVTLPLPSGAAGMRLVWSDEFDTPGLPDATKWVHDTERNRAGWYNNELQYYANRRLENARVENGRLLITARQERLNTAPDFGGQNYTSARLITRGLASWTYGFYEVRAKLPCGLGTWPAIWMLGTGGRWPDDGEIDIMEQRGTSAQAKREVLGTLHTKAYNWSGGTMGVAKSAATPLPNACTSFNNYQMSWDADRIAIGVNGTNYFEFLNPKNGDRAQWPFDAPQFMILNLAIGGDLGGAVNNAALPAVMEVEYVRVFQR
jgi:beta-glucanase (GH16 family)